MAAFEPFEAAKGGTQSLAVGAGAATSQTLNIPTSISNTNMCVLVTYANYNATGASTAYVRITTEASTTIAATSADTPLVAAPGASAVRLFASPNATAAYNVAVIVTVTPSTAGQIWFTPGQGGIL